jgi:outer membrane biosynthesis protein TonB
VEPVLPREAQRRRLRVEAVVELVVNDRGAVDDATILELYTLDDDVRTLVLEVGYGIERAILDAARSCRFRPGRISGQPTTAATQLIFTVGR